MHTATNVRISGTGSYAPATVLTNEELEARVPTSAQWVFEHLGIRERRIAGPQEFTSDLAAEAARQAIASAGIKPGAVDLIIVATATPDRSAPSTACMVQHKLGIGNRCAAFDVAAVCSGFLYAMTIASQFIEGGTYNTVLVIGADTFSRITDWTRRDAVFFGDGAGAVVMTRSRDGEGLFSSLLFADGCGQDNFTVYPGDAAFTMNGRAVYEIGTSVLPEAIRAIVAANGLQLSDIAAIVPHQPSIRMLKRTAELLELPFDIVHTNMDRYANTSSGTIPILLDEVAREQKIQPGDYVVFAAVGSGWTWGAALYRW